MDTNLNFYSNLKQTIQSLNFESIAADRKEVLQPLIDYLQNKVNKKERINLNLICTHNSRRSHLSQIWAQTAAAYYDVKEVYCYSGGTEATALFPEVAVTLTHQGFEINTIAEGSNPVYAIKFNDETLPIIGFSKKYDAAFNPKSNFAAIMTCSQADEGCPFIIGAEKRIPITYEDPKLFDNTDFQSAKYIERSLQIATEMCYVFSKINK